MSQDTVRRETWKRKNNSVEADVSNEDLYKGLVRHLESVTPWMRPDYQSIKASYLKHRDITDISELQRRRQAIEEAIEPLRKQRTEDYAYTSRITTMEQISPIDAYNMMREIDLGFEGEVVDFLIKANANRKDVSGDFSTGMEKSQKKFNKPLATVDERQ